MSDSKDYTVDAQGNIIIFAEPRIPYGMINESPGALDPLAEPLPEHEIKKPGRISDVDVGYLVEERNRMEAALKEIRDVAHVSTGAAAAFYGMLARKGLGE
jgi:hypothetical protein